MTYTSKHFHVLVNEGDVEHGHKVVDKLKQHQLCHSVPVKLALSPVIFCNPEITIIIVIQL